MSARRFELEEGTSKKFWEVTVDGSTVRTRWGRIGTTGRTTDTTTSSAAEAEALASKLAAEKTRKGYAEVVAAAEAPVAPTAAPVSAPEPAKAPNEQPAPAAKKPKPPKKSSDEYQAVAAGWRAILDLVTQEDVDPDAVRDALDALLVDPQSIPVLDAEFALAHLCETQTPHEISTDADVEKLWANDPPEERAEAHARNALARERHGRRIEGRHRLIVRLLGRGADPFAIPKRDFYTPLERYLRTLPGRFDDEKFTYPWETGAGITVREVVEAFERAGDAGVTAPPGRQPERGSSALTEAVTSAYPMFGLLLARGPDAFSSLDAWSTLVFRHGLDPAWEATRLTQLAEHLARRGAAGLVFEGRPGAMLLAITWRNLDALEALVAAGADLDAPAPRDVKARVMVPTSFLPAIVDGDPQQQELVVNEGFTARDAAEALLARYDAWEAFLGDRDGTSFATFGHSRRQDHAKVRAMVDALSARGAAVSGRRTPEAPSVGQALPAEVKQRIDAALVGVVARLGGDGPRAQAALDGLDGGRLAPLAYFRMGCQATSALIPAPARQASLGGAWLGEPLGYSDSLAGVDPDDLGGFSPPARKVLESGEWIATRANAVAVLERSGRVCGVSVRGGVEVLAPDVVAFITSDLDSITPS